MIEVESAAVIAGDRSGSRDVVTCDSHLVAERGDAAGSHCVAERRWPDGPPIAGHEPELIAGCLDVERAVVMAVVVEPAERHQVVQFGLAVGEPVDDVVTLGVSCGHGAPRVAAATVAQLQQAAHPRRHDASRAANVDRRAVLLDDGDHPCVAAAPGGSLNSVSCPTPSLCVAVDSVGDVVTSTDPNGRFSTWNSTFAGGAGSVNGVSCPTTSLCVAVDDSGDVVTSTNPTGAASAWIVSNVDGSNRESGVSCTGSDLCVAVDSHGDVLTTRAP